MTSAVDVCNNALLNIGARSSISSLTEDSAEARTCNLQYTSTLQTLLRSAPWNFARKFATLGLLKALPGTPENTTTPTSSVWSTAYPPPPWLYSYAYPSDCIMARYVMAQANNLTAGVPIFSTGNYYSAPLSIRPNKFAVTADQDSSGNAIKVICSNDSQALICYTYNCINPDLWDAEFYNAMQDALAGAIAIPLTGKIDLAKALLQKANGSIMQARLADGNEGLTSVDVVPDWLRVRGVPSLNEEESYFAPWGPFFSLPASF